MAYRHQARVHKKHQKAWRVAYAAGTASLLLLIGFGVVAVDWLREKNSTSNTVVSTENTTSVQSVNVSVHRSPYFQFQAPDDWIHVASESTDTRYVYVKNNDILISQKFVVEIDRPANEREFDRKITYVMPVTLQDNQLVSVYDNYISDHCINGWPEGLIRNPTRITHDNVSFVCAPDSTQYNIAIGLDGGSEDIPVTLNDGSQVDVSLQFSDLTAYPGSGDLFSIIKSFRTL